MRLLKAILLSYLISCTLERHSMITESLKSKNMKKYNNDKRIKKLNINKLIAK